MIRRCVAATVVGLALGALLTLPSNAAAAATAPGASADAYGVFVGVTLLQGNVPVNIPPQARSTHDTPPGGNPATNSLAQVGPQPADGSVIQDVSALATTANTTDTPTATATAETANVALLATAGVPTISATLLKAVSNSSCTQDPNATGTDFVDLKVGTVVVPNNPAPNTVIPLGLLTVIVNEQHPASDGRGLVVNALHVTSTGAGSPLLHGDIIVSHALSTVVCPNGAGSTGGSSPITLNKTASVSSVHPGDQFSYSATITNHSTTPCLVNSFIDHLPQAFTFTSTNGALGTHATATNRSGGGSDVTITPSPTVTIPAGASVSQTFVVTTKPDAAPGTYANDLELLCSDQGDFVKGLDAPVTVLAAPATTTTTRPATTPTTARPSIPGSQVLAHTGGSNQMLALLGAAALVVVLCVRRLIHTQPFERAQQ